MPSMFHDTAMTENTESSSTTTAEDWYYNGSRVWYDPRKRLMASRKSDATVGVFEKVVNDTTIPGARWLTLLPGFPDGSFGYAKIEEQLSSSHYSSSPRLYVEYVGQGDSDRPTEKGYKYSTMERANLVQAQWYAHGVKRTVVVTFDYSSLVLFELLRRCQDNRSPTVIEHVMCINGKLDPSKSNTGDLFRSIAMKVAPKSSFVLDAVVLKPMYSREYKARQGRAHIRQELKEKRLALLRHDNSAFILSKGFVCEVDGVSKLAAGKSNTNPNELKKVLTKRWDLSSIYTSYCMNRGITVQLICSKDDPYESQYQNVKQSLGELYYPNVRIGFIPGGHMALSEHAELLADKIQALASRGCTADTATQRSWVTLDAPTPLPTYNKNHDHDTTVGQPTKKPFARVTLSKR